MREFAPIPDPSGSLQPPDRWPPTAVGTGTPEPEPQPRPLRRPRPHRLKSLLKAALAAPALVAMAAIYPVVAYQRRRRRRGRGR